MGKILGIYIRVIGELMVDDMLFYRKRYFRTEMLAVVTSPLEIYLKMMKIEKR
jgi:hypothetical protein